MSKLLIFFHNNHIEHHAIILLNKYSLECIYNHSLMLSINETGLLDHREQISFDVFII